MKNCICQQCGKPFKSYNPHPKFCSLKCKIESQIHFVDFNDAKDLYEKGMSQTEIAEFFNTTQKVIYNLFKRNNYKCRIPAKRNQWGSNNTSWVGDKAKYATLHQRVESLKGKPKHCEICGTADPNVRYEWANVTGNYYDIEHGYKRMCVKCHRNFDHSIYGVKRNVG